MSVRILIGDCRERLRELPDASVNCCVTSPPYFGLRDYGTASWVGGDPGCEHDLVDARRTLWANDVKGPGGKGKNGTNYANTTKEVGGHCSKCGAERSDGQIGLEASPDQFVAELVSVFREVRRALRDDGTLWLNIGDSYAGSWGNYGGQNRSAGKQRAVVSGSRVPNEAWDERTKFRPPGATGFPGVKPKDLIGIPWMLAFALRADGWFLRQDIIWSKPNPMPESVRDRCTKAHEYLFLLSKSDRYFYDQAAILEGLAEASIARLSQPTLDQQAGSDRVPGKTNGPMKAVARQRGLPPRHSQYAESSDQSGLDMVGRGQGRNKRSVWEVATQPFSEAHFATYPPALIEPCILAGCPKGGTVLDPFGGAGTTGLVADRLQRDAILIELNPEYAAIAERRVHGDAPLFAQVAA